MSESAREFISTSDDAPSSARDIASKFAARFPGFTCSVCGEQDLLMVDKDDRSFSTRLNVYPANDRQPGFFQTTTLACSNCGHIYQFITDILRVALNNEG